MEKRGVLKGEADHLTQLTDEGWSQARTVGAKLRETFGAFDVAFHSGYARTADTASGILEAWPEADRERVEMRQHLFLRERDGGYTFNMTSSEAKESFPWLQDYWDTFGPFYSRPPGGESLADVATRVHLFLESLKTEFCHKRLDTR